MPGVESVLLSLNTACTWATPTKGTGQRKVAGRQRCHRKAREKEFAA